MRGWLVGLAGVLVGSLAVVAAEQGESLTLSTYYPSPRGAYKELRAHRYVSLSAPEKYVLDMQSGILHISRVALYDESTGRSYHLMFDAGELLVVDPDEGSAFVLMALGTPRAETQEEPARPRVSQVTLYDEATGRPYQLKVQQGKLLFVDPGTGKGYVILDVGRTP